MSLSEKCISELESGIKELNEKGKFAPATEEELNQLSDLCDGIIPEVLHKFFSECMPQEEVEIRNLVFYPLSRILAENSDYVPGCIIKPFGFVTIASTLDGDAFAVDITSPECHVYQCSHSLISEDGISFYAKKAMVHYDLNHENIAKSSLKIAKTGFSGFITLAKYGYVGNDSVVDYVIKHYKKSIK